jgi:hypothetical protein
VVEDSMSDELGSIGLNTLLEAGLIPDSVLTTIGLKGRSKSRSYFITGDVPLIPYIAVIVEGDAFDFLYFTGITGCSGFTNAMGEYLTFFGLDFFEPSGKKSLFFLFN